MIYKDILNTLSTKIPKTDTVNRLVFDKVWAYRNMNHINNWHLLHMKALCFIYGVEGMEDFSVPSEIDGIKIFYALTYEEVRSIIGSDKNRVHYYNNTDSTDEAFVKWTSANYSREYKELPQYAVIYANDIWYVSEERFSEAEKLTNQDKIE